MTESDTFWSHVDKTDTCWLWTQSRRWGYGQCWFRKRNRHAHRVAWILTNGPVPDGLLVCHHCDVRHCVRPDHLFVGTQRDNIYDMLAKGRGAPVPRHAGTTHWKARFTEQDIRDIRTVYRQGSSLRNLGRQYGVWYTTISCIINRKTWDHVA